MAIFLNISSLTSAVSFYFLIPLKLDLSRHVAIIGINKLKAKMKPIIERISKSKFCKAFKMFSREKSNLSLTYFHE